MKSLAAFLILCGVAFGQSYNDIFLSDESGYNSLDDGYFYTSLNNVLTADQYQGQIMTSMGDGGRRRAIDEGNMTAFTILRAEFTLIAIPEIDAASRKRDLIHNLLDLEEVDVLTSSPVDQFRAAMIGIQRDAADAAFAGIVDKLATATFKYDEAVRIDGFAHRYFDSGAELWDHQDYLAAQTRFTQATMEFVVAWARADESINASLSAQEDGKLLDNLLWSLQVPLMMW